MGKHGRGGRMATALFDELTELLGDIVGTHLWHQADLIIDRPAGTRRAVIYADSQDLPQDQVAFDSGERAWDVRDGSDEVAVIAAVRVLAAAAGDVARHWDGGGVQVWHLPLSREAYEPLIGVGITREALDAYRVEREAERAALLAG
ncbi:hypothetical protein ABZT26_25850 [Streptomyces sp. NPDC005395]|uniref:hypothetical protein n=1 Tax=Streptomyces sp. NPDC005395 TaxID=3157042 RepID=UPI0033B8F935